MGEWLKDIDVDIARYAYAKECSSQNEHRNLKMVL